MPIDEEQKKREALGKLTEVLIGEVKRKGGKLDLVDKLIRVSSVEGDAIDVWHLVVTEPYRGTKYSKPLKEHEALKQLRTWRSELKRELSAVEREINWISGVDPYAENI